MRPCVCVHLCVKCRRHISALWLAVRSECEGQFCVSRRKSAHDFRFFMPLKGSNHMKKILIVCIIALAAAFSVTGCATTSASTESSHSESETSDCCKEKETTASELPDCCKNKEHSDNNSSETSDVPDCCAGE